MQFTDNENSPFFSNWHCFQQSNKWLCFFFFRGWCLCLICNLFLWGSIVWEFLSLRTLTLKCQRYIHKYCSHGRLLSGFRFYWVQAHWQLTESNYKTMALRIQGWHNCARHRKVAISHFALIRWKRGLIQILNLYIFLKIRALCTHTMYSKLWQRKNDVRHVIKMFKCH